MQYSVSLMPSRVCPGQFDEAQQRFDDGGALILILLEGCERLSVGALGRAPRSD